MRKRKFGKLYATLFGLLTGGVVLTLATSPHLMDAVRVAVDGIRFN